MNPRLAVFDIDGTICDSLEAEGRCFAQAVASVTGRPLPTLDWSQYAEPTSAGIVSELLAGHPDASGEARKIEQAFLATLRAERERNSAAFQPLPGVNAFLHRLREESICAIAFATGCFATEARFKLACCGIDLPAFPHATSSDTTRRKDIIATAISRAGHTDRREIIYFGDAAWDVRASEALGIPLIGIGQKIAHLRTLGAFATFADFSAPDAMIAAMQTAWSAPLKRV